MLPRRTRLWRIKACCKFQTIPQNNHIPQFAISYKGKERPPTNWESQRSLDNRQQTWKPGNQWAWPERHFPRTNGSPNIKVCLFRSVGAVLLCTSRKQNCLADLWFFISIMDNLLIFRSLSQELAELVPAPGPLTEHLMEPGLADAHEKWDLDGWIPKWIPKRSTQKLLHSMILKGLKHSPRRNRKLAFYRLLKKI